MNVILLTSWFFEYTIALSNALSNIDNINVTLIMPGNTVKSHLGDSWDKLLNKNINVKLFDYGHDRRLKTLLKAPFTIYSLIKYIYILKPDVLHIQESPGAFVCLALPLINRYPIVSTNHDVKPHVGYEKGFKNFIRELMRKIATKYSDKIIVHGEYLRNIAISYLHVQAADVHIIPHGELSFEKWDRKRIIGEEQGTILFFGRIGKYKGLDYLIKAEPIISRSFPNLKIIIAGRGDSFQEYEKLMVNKERFECHLRYIPNEMVPELFQRSSVVVLPYIEASQSGVIPVAYEFKKPVVVTDVGSIPEVVDNGKTGFIVPSKDSEALAKVIIKLLENDKLRNEMGENGYRKIREELSWGKIAEKTIKVYEEAIRDHANK